MSITQVREALPAAARQMYLDVLRENLGNEIKAVRQAGISLRELDAYRASDAEFKDAEIMLKLELGAELEEESRRIALGREPMCKDSGHLRWALAKENPDKYGEKARQVDIRYSGNITVDSALERVQTLLAMPDIDEGETSE